MANFFVDKEAFSSDPIVVSGEEANHMIKVLRMKEGEKLTLFDGEGNCADGEIEAINGKEVFVNAGEEKIMVFSFINVGRTELLMQV